MTKKSSSPSHRLVDWAHTHHHERLVFLVTRYWRVKHLVKYVFWRSEGMARNARRWVFHPRCKAHGRPTFDRDGTECSRCWMENIKRQARVIQLRPK